VSRVQYVFASPFDWSPEEEVRLEALSGILEMRLNEVLREEQGGTYSVGVFSSTSRNPRAERRVFIGFGCEPARVEELSGLMMRELERLVREGPDGDRLAKQKEIMRRSLELATRTNAWWADGIATSLRRLLDPVTLTRRAGLIEGLDAAALAATARGSLRTDRYIRVVLVPAP
jgi:zinc protease